VTRERIVSSKPLDSGDESFIQNLRPTKLNEYIGQKDILEKISIAVTAAKNRGEPVEHMLFFGPPGLGKTTLARIIEHEMGTKLFPASGPALVRAGDLVGILSSLNVGDILFIDEIHRLPNTVEEFIYPAMEDFKMDFVIEKGAMAKTINVPLKRFTLIGATTRAGALSAPLRNRFGMFYLLDFYPEDEIQKIIERSAGILKMEMEPGAVTIIASRSRGTPRIANRLLRRVRDYVQVKSDGRVTSCLTEEALEIEGVDKMGFDHLDRKYLRVIIEHYDGGPVGIDAIAATLNEDSETLIGFIQRRPRGRTAGREAYSYLGYTQKSPHQGEIFTN